MASNPNQNVQPIDHFIFVQGRATPLPSSTAQEHMRQGRYIYDRFGHPVAPASWAPNVPFVLQPALDPNHPAYGEAVPEEEIEGSFATQVAWIEDVERYNLHAQTFTGSTKYQGRKRGKKQAPKYNNGRQGRVTDWQFMYQEAVAETYYANNPTPVVPQQQLYQPQHQHQGLFQQPDGSYAPIAMPAATYALLPHVYQPAPAVTASTGHGTNQPLVAANPTIHAIPPSTGPAYPPFYPPTTGA